MSKNHPSGGLLDGEYYQLVCGGREFSDAQWMKNHLERVIEVSDSFELKLTIVTGGARGADRLATDVAESLGLPTIVIEADWDHDGKRAGYLRNERMSSLLTTFETRGARVSCVAFPGGKGTSHMREIAKRDGIQVYWPARRPVMV